KVLTTPDITDYRSVAYIKSDAYWRDMPGQHGLRLNYDLLDRGVHVERIFTIGWDYWGPETTLPRQTLRRAIEEQHYRGISVLLVRESDLVCEPDLLCDFGLYGTGSGSAAARAVGELHTDNDSRTVSFTLWFDPAVVELFQERWRRLRLFARPYAELLERTGE